MITQFLSDYHLLGITIGATTFAVIGLFHPIVIKCHYRYGTGCWWWFLILGIVGCAVSYLSSDVLISSIAGVFAFSSFWTIKEVFEQEKRVDKGWYPRNPNRA